MESGDRNNFGRRGGGSACGRSGGGYKGQGGGRGRGGSMRPQRNRYHYQGRGQQRWGNGPPVQAYQGGGGGSGGSPRPWGSRPVQSDPSQGSDAGVQSPTQQQVGFGSASSRGAWTGRPWGRSSRASAQPRPSTGTNNWTGRHFGPAAAAPAQPTSVNTSLQLCHQFLKLILLLIEGAWSFWLKWS